jgi:serine/threonine-protein kinase
VLGSKYRLERVLGIGGMATVYAATHLRNANRVAVKILHRELAIDADLRARFLREGYAANSVEHQGTVRILDDDTTEDGAVFLVMELLVGETVDARWVRSGRKLGVGEVATIIGQLLDVLAAAHAKGVVHRDIKPENLFLTKAGELKVLDFGVARLRESSPTRTKTGTVFGTPAFMAPEQALGRAREVDCLSDIWAVGATAFTLLSGRFVHHAETAEETVVRAATRSAPPLASIVSDVPSSIAQVIDRALAFERADRWPSAPEMKDALANACGAEAEAAPTSDWDGETQLAPPPAMTLHLERPRALDPPGGAGTVPLRTLPAVSTVAGVASHSEARRARRERKVIAAGVGGLFLVVATAIVALATSGKRPMPAPLDVRPNSAPVAVPASAPVSSAPPAMSNDLSPAAVPVESLPTATPKPRPATIPTSARPPARPLAVTPPASTQTLPPVPAPPPKRDPLAP